MAKTYTFESLEKKYNNFFAPAFEVDVGGTKLTRSFLPISRITVQTTTESMSDTCTFTVTNDFDLVSRDFVRSQLLQPGKPVQVKMGYTDKLETVFTGYITSIKYQFPQSGNPSLAVTCMDLSFFMKRKKEIITWQNRTFSDIAYEIARKYNAKTDIDATEITYPRIPQNKMTDYELLDFLARRSNREFFVSGGTLYFRKPMENPTPILTLTWGKNLTSFQLEVNIAKQVNEVVVTGMDYKQQEVITASVSSRAVVSPGSKRMLGSDFIQVFGVLKELMETNVVSMNEAKLIAESMMLRRSMHLLIGSGECIGIPELQVGRYIQIQGVGEKLSQNYYLISVIHTISEAGYTTSFRVGGNAI